MGGTPTIEQTDWAFYNDGTESGSTIIGTKNTNPTKGDLDNDTTYLARFGLEETAGNKWNNPSVQLQYNHNSGGWNNVTTTSSVIKAVDSSSLTDGGNTTQRMTSFTYESTNNGISEDGLQSTSTDPQSTGYEALFSFQIVAADVSDNDTIVLRVIETGDGITTYNQTDPTITVQAAAPPINLTANCNGLTTTADISATITRSLTANANGVTTTADIVTVVTRELTAVADGVTTTADIVLDVVSSVNLTADCNGVTTTADITAVVARDLTAVADGATTTADVVAIIERDLTNVSAGATATAGIVLDTGFISTIDGNWNDGATWGNSSPGTEGVDWPSTTGGDTFTVAAGHEVTIPDGHSTISNGVLADSLTSDHGKLIILGSLKLDGNLVVNDFCELHVGNGATAGVLDLDGNNLSLGPDSLDEYWLTFQGVSSAVRSSIQSTTAGGTVTCGATAYAVVDWDYVAITDLGAANWCYRANGINVQYLSIVDSNQQLFVTTTTTLDVIFNGIDLRDPSVTATRTLNVAATATPTAGTRSLSNITASATTGYGKIYWDVESGPVTGLIVDEYQIELGEPDNTLDFSFFNCTQTPSQAILSPLAGADYALQDSYIYASGVNAHPLGNLQSGSLITTCVMEGLDAQTNWLISNSASIDMTYNIVIGAGTLFSSTGGAANPGTYNLKHNTIYTADAVAAQAMLLMTEGVGTVFTGTVNIADNLVVDSDTTSNNTGIYLVDGTADQITSVDYTCWYGYTGGDLFDRYNNVDITGKTEGVDAGFGGNDLNVDPQFLDKTRTIASWDTSLGGVGTAANAITEMLKLNGYGGAFDTDYTVSNLLTYIRAGFTPQNSALDGTASDSGDIGAVSFTVVSLTADCNGTTTTADIVTTVERNLTADANGITTTADITLTLDTVITLTANCNGVTTAADIIAAVERDLTADANGVTTTAYIMTVVGRDLTADANGVTTTADIIVTTDESTINLTASCNGIVSTADIMAVVGRNLTADINGVTVTGSPGILMTRALTASADGVVDTSALFAIVTRELSAAATGAVATAEANMLIDGWYPPVPEASEIWTKQIVSNELYPSDDLYPSELLHLDAWVPETVSDSTWTKQ